MNRFHGLSHRDQLALLIGGLLMLGYGLWFGLIDPVREHASRQAILSDTATNTLVQVRALAGDISLLEQSGAGHAAADINVAHLVDRSLNRNQLSMSGFQPGKNGDVRLRLEGTDFNKLLQWLYEMEYEHKLLIAELSITPTRNPGQVSAQVKLQGTNR